MYPKLILILLLVIPSTITFATTADDISIVTEASSFAFLEGDEVKGTGTELVREVIESADLSYKISILPWARAYRDATTMPNTLIYALSRTQERENKFHWVGKILALDYKFYRLTSRRDIVASDLNSLKKYKVVVNRSDIAAQFLERQAFKNIFYASSLELELKLLLAYRVDLMILSANGIKQNLATTNIDSAQLEPIFDIDEISTSTYMAFSKQTPIHIVEKARKAYTEIVRDGRYQKIMASRL